MASEQYQIHNIAILEMQQCHFCSDWSCWNAREPGFFDFSGFKTMGAGFDRYRDIICNMVLCIFLMRNSLLQEGKGLHSKRNE